MAMIEVTIWMVIIHDFKTLNDDEKLILFFFYMLYILHIVYFTCRMLSSSPLLSLSSFRSSYLDVEDGDDDDNGWLADLFLSTVKTVMRTIIMVESCEFTLYFLRFR